MPLPIPGQPAPQPATPPGIRQAPPGVGPATAPQGNQGNTAAAMQDIRNAVKMLEKSLPMIPMGSPLHEKIHKVTLDLSKELTQGDENPALQLQSLVQMLRSQQQSQPLSALSRLYPGAQGNTPPATGGAPEPQPTA